MVTSRRTRAAIDVAEIVGGQCLLFGFTLTGRTFAPSGAAPADT